MTAASGLVSNAVDMARWLLFQLRRGEDLTGISLVSPGIMEETHSPASLTSLASHVHPDTLTSFIVDKYALGWAEGYYRGKSSVGKYKDKFYMIVQRIKY